jgi:hypothetical protein
MSKAKTIFSHFGDDYAATTMAFIGGFIDAVGFVKMHHLFTSSITGNLVVAVAAPETDAGAICPSSSSLRSHIRWHFGSSVCTSSHCPTSPSPC